MVNWEGWEEAVLLTRYARASWTELMGLLPRHTLKAIKMKAKAMDLKRSQEVNKKLGYATTGLCQVHGRILINEIQWRGKDKNIAYCSRPYCNRRLRMLPRSSKLRRKYKQ